jgi:hypothetical protein
MSDLASNLTKAFAGMKQARETPGEKLKRELQESVAAAGPQGTRGTRSARSGGQGPGPRLAPLPLHDTPKSKHPEYKAVKVFMREDNHRAAARKWRYEKDGDFSDLVDHLVQQYLNT